MKLNKLFLVGIAFLALVFTNCNTNEEGVNDNSSFSFGNNITSNFAGKVVDSNNNAIAGVLITMSGQTTTTDSIGNFLLNNVTVKENFGYLTATKTGFINGSRTVISHDGINNLKIMLLNKNVVATIPSGESSVVTLSTGTKITFDGAFVQENGTAYTGNVNISMNYLSPTDPNVFVKMPGSLLGTRTDGSISGMETYGMVNVEMYGSNNEKLQLEAGHTANISMPIVSNQLDTAAAIIPLWYFNETTGLWQEQGFSRKIGNRYIGNVSHFTWWNNDCSFVVATLHVTVKNADGTFVQGVKVTITRQNGSTGDVLIDLGTTGANGQLSASVPKDEVLIFKAYTSDGQLINTQELPASSEVNRYVTVIIPVLNKN